MFRFVSLNQGCTGTHSSGDDEAHAIDWFFSDYSGHSDGATRIQLRFSPARSYASLYACTPSSYKRITTTCPKSNTVVEQNVALNKKPLQETLQMVSKNAKINCGEYNKQGVSIDPECIERAGQNMLEWLQQLFRL